MNIPISSVELGEDEEKLVLEVVRSGRLAQGPMVQRLEEEFREWAGSTHVVAVNNGTTALVAALQALGIGPGDEVVTTPFSFVATLNAILETGATAVFADVTEDDFTLDPAAVEEQITDRTRAILPVHLYGLPADMPSLRSLAERHDLEIVEDAAQAHGAAVGGRRVGSWGVGCFSLYATKNVTAGEGGLVTTDDAVVADRLRLLRNQGMRERYQYELPGHNYRMTELQAAIAIPQLARLGERTQRRRSNAAHLSEHLADLPGLLVPREVPGREHVWHQYTLRVGEGAPVGRDELVVRLDAAGIGTGVYYPRLIHDYPCYQGHPGVRITPSPRAGTVVREVLSLPVHPGLSQDELAYIVTTMRTVWGA